MMSATLTRFPRKMTGMFLLLFVSLGCGESGNNRPAATAMFTASRVVTATRTASPVETATASLSPVTATATPTVPISFTPVTTTPTATPSMAAPPPGDSAEIAAELLSDIADDVCNTDSTPGGAVRVQPVLYGAVIDCTSFTGHRGTVELRAYVSAAEAASALEHVLPGVSDVVIGGGLLRRSCVPADCGGTGALTQDWAWVKRCWLVEGHSFDDTSFHLSPQPHATIEELVGSSFSGSLLTCPLVRCGDASTTARFDECRGSSSEGECATAGGRWGRYPFSGRPGCFCPTGQAGCSCTSANDCVGKCYAPHGGGLGSCTGVTQGVCSTEDPEGGCWCVFDASGRAGGLCIDP